jgi:transposase
MEAGRWVEFHLSLSELTALERCEKSAELARRIRIVILAMNGWTAPAVAMATGLSRRVCQEWVARFNKSGLSGLDDRRGRVSRAPLTSEQEVAVRQRIESGPTEVDQVCSLRGKDFQRILSEEFGVQRSLTAVYNLLHSLGYSYLRPRPIHRKSDPVAMEEFKQQWPEKQQSIAARHPDKWLQVYFQDESRFGQQGTTTSVWAKKGSRLTAIRQTENQYLWVIGAVCPRTGHAEGLISPQLNTENHQPVSGSVLTHAFA